MRALLPLAVLCAASLPGCSRNPAQGPARRTLSAHADVGPVRHDREHMHQSINAPGAAIELQAQLVPGKRTVLQYYADWCGTCAVWKKKIDVAAAHMPDTVMLYVDVVDFDTPAAKQFGVSEVPYFRIYDPGGRLVSEGRTAYDSLWAEIHRYPDVPR